MDNKNHTDVLDNLSTLRSGSIWSLEFSPALEKNYQFSQNEWYRDAIQVSVVLAILLMVLGFCLELGTGVTVGTKATIARGIAMASLLGAYLYMKRSLRLTWKFWVVSLNTMLVAVTLLLLAHDATNQTLKIVYYCYIFFLEVVVFAFVRLPLNFTTTLGLVLLLMVGGALYFDSIAVQLAAHIVFFLLGGTLLAVMVSVKTEKVSRSSFLKAQLILHQKEQLRVLNDQLTEQSRLDRVTRLLNRVAFEDQLMSQWTLAHQSKQNLALVAIHIEQFTYFNERYGTDMGDDFLREISRKIRSLLVDKEHIASRISGSRFVILLANPAAASSSDLLEKLRGKLLSLSTLKKCQNDESVYLTWGRVLLEADLDRDPRGTIDRMFKHLTPVNETSVCEAPLLQNKNIN